MLLGAVTVVPLGVVGTAVPEGSGGALGWGVVVLAAVGWVEPAALLAEGPACGAMASPECVVSLVTCDVAAGEIAALVGGGGDVAGAWPGTPGTGSSAAGGMGPPAKLMPSRQAYPHKAATTAIVSRRQFLRRRPEASTNTGDDGAGFPTKPAPSATSPSSGPGTPLAGAGVVDICTASGGPYCTVPSDGCMAGQQRTGIGRRDLHLSFDVPAKEQAWTGLLALHLLRAAGR